MGRRVRKLDHARARSILDPELATDIGHDLFTHQYILKNVPIDLTFQHAVKLVK